jgi:hypothetical protein
MISSCAMPSKKKAPHSEQESSYAVGDRVKVNLHTGRIVDATVKAVSWSNLCLRVRATCPYRKCYPANAFEISDIERMNIWCAFSRAFGRLGPNNATCPVVTPK